MKSLQEFERTRQKCLDALYELLRIPSLSRDKEKVSEAADWLITRLKQSADRVEWVETAGNPVVLAEWNPQGSANTDNQAPTVLFYGHYDVQPPDPLDKWLSPPFEPEMRDGRIFARGVGDNKGQLFANLCAVEYAHQAGELGLRVKFILDGEEEVGSPHLHEALNAKKAFFNDVDLIIVSDGPADSSWRPEISFGVRGIVTVQLELRSAKDDVHSGNFGGIQPNPVWDLLEILHTMRDEHGRCLIKGFYDDVFTPDPRALEALDEFPRTPDTYTELLGISYFGGEQDQPIMHRVMFRPTINIRGFQAGSVREHARTIIPKEAVAELDMRLVPHQKPEKIEALFRAHINALRDRSARWAAVIDRCKLTFETSFHPMHTPLDLPWTDVLVDAVREGFGEDPVKVPISGGSLPLYDLYEITGKPLYVIPYAQPDEANHAPNENLMVDWFYKGVTTSIILLDKLAERPFGKS